MKPREIIVMLHEMSHARKINYYVGLLLCGIGKGSLHDALEDLLMLEAELEYYRKQGALK